MRNTDLRRNIRNRGINYPKYYGVEEEMAAGEINEEGRFREKIKKRKN